MTNLLRKFTLLSFEMVDKTIMKAWVEAARMAAMRKNRAVKKWTISWIQSTTLISAPDMGGTLRVSVLGSPAAYKRSRLRTYRRATNQKHIGAIAPRICEPNRLILSMMLDIQNSTGKGWRMDELKNSITLLKRKKCRRAETNPKLSKSVEFDVRNHKNA